MENAFRNLRSLSQNGLWRGDERNACGLCEQFRYWPVLLPQTPQLLSSRWFATLLAYNSPHSLDSTTKERKVCRVLRFEDDSTIQEISTPTKCSRSKFASRFKLKPRRKSLVSALEHQLKIYFSSSTNSMAIKVLLWGTNCCPEPTILANTKARKCPLG